MATFTHNTGEPTLVREKMPRFPSGEAWYPHGFGPESPDKALADTLRNAWGTPAWVLDEADDILLRAGAPLPTFDPACRPESEAYKRIQARGGFVCCGVEAGAQALNLGSEPSPGGRNVDGLAQPWASVTPAPDRRARGFDRVISYQSRPSLGSIWLNHPWSKPDEWIARAVEAVRAGLWVQVLAPHTTGKWWVSLWQYAAYVTCLSKVCFDLCPGLEGCLTNSPPQQVSLVTMAPVPHSSEYPFVRSLPTPSPEPKTNPVDGRSVWTLTGPRWHEYARIAAPSGRPRS